MVRGDLSGEVFSPKWIICLPQKAQRPNHIFQVWALLLSRLAAITTKRDGTCVESIYSGEMAVSIERKGGLHPSEARFAADRDRCGRFGSVAPASKRPGSGK